MILRSRLMPKSSRISLRTRPELKDLIERAAMTTGLTLTDYALNVLVTHARQVLDENGVRVLSPRDTHAFLNLLERGARPNAALRRAGQRYKQRAGRTALDD